jgi:hypothetical protein
MFEQTNKSDNVIDTKCKLSYELNFVELEMLLK